MMACALSAIAPAPAEIGQGTWVGRAWVPGVGPAVIAVRNGEAFDIRSHVATMSALCDKDDPVSVLRVSSVANPLASLDALLRNADLATQNAQKPYLLAPIDLQVIKAAGVTFAASMVERVVEEQAKGDPAAAGGIRAASLAEIGTDLATIVPGQRIPSG